MENQLIYNNLFERSLPYPLPLLEFLKTELQLGKKYVVLDVHRQNGQMSRLLHKHVHLVCSLSTELGYQQFLKQKFQETANFLSVYATPEQTNLEEDSIDCLCIDETFNSFDILKMKVEFERILRLNSYVLIIQNQIKETENIFSQALLALFDEEKINSSFVRSSPSTNQLASFYSNGCQQQLFQNQQRWNWEQLEHYYKTMLEVQEKELKILPFEKLKRLFDAHERDGQVILEFQTMLYYGLFNYSVPEISLRKSIFFNLLRPFAFGFYVLVKANIYFWKALYKIKLKIFG